MFLYSSSVYSCHLFLISSASVSSVPFLSFIVLIFAWNVPLVSLIFLKEEISFLSHCIIFLCFFALIAEEGFLISLCYSLELCIQMLISFLFSFARRQWHPTPALLPGKSHGRRSLVGCSPWGREELDTTEWLHFPFLFFSQLFVRPPQTAILLFCISFPWGWSWSLSPV